MEQVQRLKEQLEICGEQLRQKEASLRDAWRDLARRKADTTVEEDNKKLKVALCILHKTKCLLILMHRRIWNLF